MNEQIADDIEKLANYWLDIRTYSHQEIKDLTKAAERVEAWLATNKTNN